MVTVFLICLTLLIFATSTGFLILRMFEIKHEKELEQFTLQLQTENNQIHNQKVREKLIKFLSFLEEMALDFSLIFPSIDFSAKMSQDDFCNRYLPLWNKVGEIQLVADFYVPSIKELTQELDGLTTDYWRYLHKILVIREGDCFQHCAPRNRTSPDYLEAEKYAQIVPAKINDIKQKIRERTY